MQKINWGIIGCGDVTEVKSGPAFNKVKHSALVAVMRRDAAKAADYARRHKVPRWYTDAGDLLSDPEVNAVYIATPPSSHEEYTRAAAAAGKSVYVEKPMSTDAKAAERMLAICQEYGVKLVVAHYRRAQPVFKKIKQLLEQKAIGDIRLARLVLYKQALSAAELAVPKTAWRVDKLIAGGGLFHDLAPHQLDLAYHFFGEPEKVTGLSANQARLYSADDIVSGSILFRSGVIFSGNWCFSVNAADEKDLCEIIGTGGKISFSVFDQAPVKLSREGNTESFSFDTLEHVQQPMIEEVVNYFLAQAPNPCSAEDGVKIMQLIDAFTAP